MLLLHVIKSGLSILRQSSGDDPLGRIVDCNALLHEIAVSEIYELFNRIGRIRIARAASVECRFPLTADEAAYGPSIISHLYWAYVPFFRFLKWPKCRLEQVKWTQNDAVGLVAFWFSCRLKARHGEP